jgi:hypothetical protein
VDQSRSDTCHNFKGDTWHIYTDDVAHSYGAYVEGDVVDMWLEDVDKSSTDTW